MIASLFVLLIALFAHGGNGSPPPDYGSVAPSGSPVAPADSSGGSPMAGS